MDWNELKLLPAWLPISALPEKPVHLDDVLFRLAPTQYLICPPYNERFERVPGVNAFLGALLWAPGDGAARRSALMDIEADSPETRPIGEPLPPRELLLASGSMTYGDIIRDLREAKSRHHVETASYRVATDGAFIHRTISTVPYTFFFRNRKDDDSDPCYAIEYLPSGFKSAADFARGIVEKKS